MLIWKHDGYTVATKIPIGKSYELKLDIKDINKTSSENIIAASVTKKGDIEL